MASTCHIYDIYSCVGAASNWSFQSHAWKHRIVGPFSTTMSPIALMRSTSANSSLNLRKPQAQCAAGQHIVRPRRPTQAIKL